MLHRLLVAPACALAACALTACSGEGPAFPEGFLFGSAIAPYQTEGGLTQTDWAQWEVRCSTCSHQRADDGPGFWERYAGDLDAAQSLHNNTLRLGIEWARIFPSGDRFPDQPDEAAVARYRDVLTAARARGIAPLVTLQHYSLPVWVHDLSDPARPGWEDPAIVARFAAWAGFCGRRFGDLVDLWQTINEPVPGIVAGWVGGVFPPGKSFATAAGLKALGHMRAAHAAAYDALHASDNRDADGDGKAALVSFAQNSGPFLPLTADQPAAQATAATLARLWNDHFLDAVTRGDVDGDFDGSLDGPADVRGDATLAGRLDFIGLNYYGPAFAVPLGNAAAPIPGFPAQNDVERFGLELPKSDFGWAIQAAGLRDTLLGLRRYGLPIYITENGVADRADALRPRFLIDHLGAVAEALAAGVDVRGYYHWSLMDNFEWASGFCPRFGLLRVEPGAPGRPRTVGEGAKVYREIIDARRVPADLRGRYPSYGAPTPCPRVGF